VSAYENMILREISRHVRAGRSVTIISFCRFQGDLAAAQRVRSRLDPDTRSAVTVHSYEGDLRGALALFKAADWILGTRLHASVVGLSLGKRVLAASYSRKTDEVLRSVGYDGPLLTLDGMGGNQQPIIDDDAYRSLESELIERAQQSARSQLNVLDEAIVDLPDPSRVPAC
jgi:polysaccharide pyruvyl transferase WcaK-like protein